jgi:hypothetical protein
MANTNGVHPRWTQTRAANEDKAMNIKQLKQLIANLPDDVEVLTWDRDTANPVEQVMAYQAPIEPIDGLAIAEQDASCVSDFTPAPRAALILVCNS